MIKTARTTWLGTSYVYKNIDKQSKYYYQASVLPGELEGINSVWNFVLTAKTAEVVDVAVEFLINLYVSVHDSIAEQQQNVIA